MGVKVEAEEVWPCQVSIAACLHHCFYCVMQEQCSGAILFLAFDIFVYFLCWFDHLIILFLLSTGFGGRQQDRPPTSKGWTKGGGGW